MPIVASGPISMLNIAQEYGGGTNPISLSEYYGASPGVPTSGTISISNFYGKSSYIPYYYAGYVSYYRRLRG